MPILEAELQKIYKSTVVSDTGGNGGRMSVIQSVGGAASNLFPAVGSAERAAGSDKYRKAFFKVPNDNDETLYVPKLYMHTVTPGDDRLYFFPGTQTDIQSDLTGSERLYGSGVLSATVLSGVTSIDVLVEDGATLVFVPGDEIFVTDRADAGDAVNNLEFNTVVGTPTVLADVVTITLQNPLSNGYTGSTTKVGSVYNAPDVVGAAASFVVTAAGSGNYDIGGFPIIVDSIGGVQDDWTLTFTDASTFNIVGANSGNLGSGNVSSDTAPVNTDFSKPFWTLLSGGFSGVFQAGDTITFTTSPAAISIWFRRIIPAGINSQALNISKMFFQGESD